MHLDWLLLTTILLTTGFLVLRQWHSAAMWTAILLLFAFTIAGARYWQRDLERRMDSDRRLLERSPAEGRPGGYIGSDSCKACHPDQYRSWHQSYHRTMTQYASPESVKGDFNNVHLEFRGETYHLYRKDREFWVEMPDPDWAYGQTRRREAYESGRADRPPPTGKAPRSRKRVGLVTGSHHMQAYWGCLQCHGSIGNSLEAHTHHSPESSGSLCYNCHMSHTSYGLLKAIRSHQIDSPNVDTTLKVGRPNACNLCHLDQTLQWTGQHLSDWYGQPDANLTGYQTNTASSLFFLLSGDAGQRALVAWHMGWEPALAAAGTDWPALYLAELLIDPYDAVRYIAQRSLKRLPRFENLQYDYIAPASQRLEARREVIETWAEQPTSNIGARSRLLLDSAGQPERPRILSLLRGRDDRAMFLWE